MRSSPRRASNAVESTRSLNATIATPRHEYMLPYYADGAWIWGQRFARRTLEVALRTVATPML